MLNNNHPITLHFYIFPFSIGAKTQPESKCPELLANYCDMLLRKTPLSKKLTSEEVETKLRDVVSLICSKSSGILCFYLEKVHGTKEKIILVLV